MPRSKPQKVEEPDLLTLLAEQEQGPPPCPHRFSVGKGGSGWAYETDPASPYYQEWVHSGTGEHQLCRRSAFPGRKQING